MSTNLTVTQSKVQFSLTGTQAVYNNGACSVYVYDSLSGDAIATIKPNTLLSIANIQNVYFASSTKSACLLVATTGFFLDGADSVSTINQWESAPATYSQNSLVYAFNPADLTEIGIFQNLTGVNTATNPWSDATNWKRIPQTTDIVINSTEQTQSNFANPSDLSTTLLQTTTAVGDTQDAINTQTTNSINNFYSKSVSILNEVAILQGKTANLSSANSTLGSQNLIDIGGYSLYGANQTTPIPANSTQSFINTSLASTTQNLASGIQTNAININTNSQEIAALASQLSVASFEAVTSASVTVTGTSSTVFTALPLKAANTQSQSAIVGGNIKISSSAATAQTESVGGNLNITKSNTNSLFNGYIYNVTAGVRVGNAVTGISGTLYNLPLRATLTVVASTTTLTNGGYNVHAGDVLQFRLYRTGNAAGTVIVTQGSSTYVYATTSGGYTNVTSNSVQMVGVTGVTSSQTLTSFVNSGVALSRLVSTIEQPTAYKSNRVYHEFCQTDVFNLKTYCPAIASANFSNGYIVESITNATNITQVFNVSINGVNTKITRTAPLTSTTWTGSLTYSDYLPSYTSQITFTKMQRYQEIGSKIFSGTTPAQTSNLNVYRAIISLNTPSNTNQLTLITGLPSTSSMLDWRGTIFRNAGVSAAATGWENLLTLSPFLCTDTSTSLIFQLNPITSITMQFGVSGNNPVLSSSLSQFQNTPMNVVIEVAAP